MDGLRVRLRYHKHGPESDSFEEVMNNAFRLMSGLDRKGAAYRRPYKGVGLDRGRKKSLSRVTNPSTITVISDWTMHVVQVHTRTPHAA